MTSTNSRDQVIILVWTISLIALMGLCAWWGVSTL